MSRMFLINGKPMITWPIFVGCDFNCTYCNARKMAETRLRNHPRYRDGFKPHFIPGQLLKTFKPGQFVFVCYMGDISFASKQAVEVILDYIRENPQVTFLFCSKDPGCYHRWRLDYPNNLYLGATIETNYDLSVLSRAPAPGQRAAAMASLTHPKLFISIEPVMLFDLTIFLSWMYQIQPQIVEVGADNYHNHLVEPGALRLKGLLTGLRSFCPCVVEKEGLERLKCNE